MARIALLPEDDGRTIARRHALIHRLGRVDRVRIDEREWHIAARRLYRHRPGRPGDPGRVVEPLGHWTYLADCLQVCRRKGTQHRLDLAAHPTRLRYAEQRAEREGGARRVGLGEETGLVGGEQ